MINYSYHDTINDIWNFEISDVVNYVEDYHFSVVCADTRDHDNLHGL